MRRLALVLAVLAGMAAFPAGAAAIVPGPNGPLIFTSGRDDGATALTDGRAQIWFLSGPGGGATRLTTLGLSHHRHASWSPDRTKIAYARGPDDGTPFDGPWDIYIDDLTSPLSAPVQVTNTPMNEDRPTWSPDGTRLAYAKEVAASSWNVVTAPATAGGGSSETTVATEASIGMGASGQFSRPQWSPGGQFIFYGRTVAVGSYDIYRAFSGGSIPPVGTAVVSGATNDYQPALSPDGTTLCFTRDSGADKDVYVAPANGGTPVALVATAAPNIDYECAWSPDGSKVAFVRGAFGMGQILMRSSDPAGPPGIDPVANVDGRFDGNPEWTYNPSPTCQNRTVRVPFNSFISIPLTCTDLPDPPTFAPVEPPRPELVTPPGRGNVGQIQADGSVIYTPNANFQGTDTFAYRTNDGTSDSNIANVVISVEGPPPPPPDTTRPEVTNLSVSRKRFRRGTRLPSASQAKVGTTISLTLSEDARATLSFQRARPGRRVGGRCVKPTRRNRTRRACKRFVSAGSFAFAGKQGVNRVSFQGRLTRRLALPLGGYRVLAGARDQAGNRSLTSPRSSFTIVRR